MNPLAAVLDGRRLDQLDRAELEAALTRLLDAARVVGAELIAEKPRLRLIKSD